MLSIVQKYLHDFQKTGDGFYIGYIDTTDIYKQFLTDLNAAGFSFSTRKSEIFKEEGHLLFRCNKSDVPVPFCGSPFRRLKNIFYECVNGSQYFGKSKKNKDCTSAQCKVDGQSPLKKTTRLKPSKKIGCKARMITKCIKIYYDYGVGTVDAHWRHKKEVILKIKKDLLSNDVEVRSLLRYFIKISEAAHHCHSITSPALGKGLHLKLTKEIRRLAKRNITSPQVVKSRLKEVVETTCENREKPELTDDGFYLPDALIKNNMYAALFDIKQSKIDQGGLEQLIVRWRTAASDDLFYFRPYKPANEDDEAQPLLFCYQSFWQKKLLQYYGDSVCLLDPMYKATNYSLPLFFLVVKTNVNFAVVGIFAIQAEISYLIEEALEMFTKWNPSWKPSFFMTGCSEAETSAVEGVLHCSAYICPVYRKLEWMKWLKKKANIKADFVEEVKHLWDHIAQSKDENELQERLNCLTDNSVWKNSVSAQKYFDAHWLPRVTRWVSAFQKREDLLNLSFNNGIASLSVFLEHSFVKHSTDKSLTELLTFLVEESLADTFLDYIKSNGRPNVSDELYCFGIPDYLRGRPQNLFSHVLSRLNIAREEYDCSNIATFCNGTFGVQSMEDSSTWHIVDFGTPSCACDDFSRWGYPCKHFCAIFLNVPDWSFDQLPRWYRESPYLIMDQQFGIFCEENISSESCIGLSEEPKSELEMLLEQSNSVAHLHDYLDVDLENIMNVVKPTNTQLLEQCHEKNEEIMNLTLICQDESHLRELLMDLTKVTDRLSKKAKNNNLLTTSSNLKALFESNGLDYVVDNEL